MEHKQGTNKPKCKRCEILYEMNCNLVKSGLPPTLIRASGATSRVKVDPVNPRLDQLVEKELPEIFFSGNLQALVDLQDGQLMAKKRIESAQVIAIVEPFMWTTAGLCYERCDFCLQNKPLTLIPCSGGCKFVMYCDERCQEMAWKKYHMLECAVMKDWGPKEVTDWVLPMLRMVCVGLTLHRNDIASLRKEFISARHIDTRPMRLDLTAYEIYTVFLGMAYRFTQQQRLIKECTLTRIQTALLKHLSSVSGKISSFDKSFLHLLLSHHIHVLHGTLKRFDILLNQTKGRYVLLKKSSVSNGWYPLYHLFGYSAKPNVAIINDKHKRKIAIALRPIAPGETLTIGSKAIDEIDDATVGHGILDPECTCNRCERGFIIRRKDLPLHSSNIKPKENGSISDDVKKVGERGPSSSGNQNNLLYMRKLMIALIRERAEIQNIN